MATVTQVSDAEIIELSRAEPERFAAVFDRYYGQIHGYAERRLGRSLGDDVAAETFLVAFDQRERYDLTRADARPWLYGIASNLIARHRRADHLHLPRHAGDRHPGPHRLQRGTEVRDEGGGEDPAQHP